MDNDLKQFLDSQVRERHHIIGLAIDYYAKRRTLGDSHEAARAEVMRTLQQTTQPENPNDS